MADHDNGAQVPVQPTTGQMSVQSIFANVDTAMYPVQLTPEHLAIHVDTPLEAVMPPGEVREKWVEIFARWRVTDGHVQAALINATLRYFIANGSSPRAPFDRYLAVRGRVYSSRVLKSVLCNDVRRFCRAQADVARSILKGDVGFAAEMGSQYGMFGHFDLAFDFSDYCTGLTQPERYAISRLKRRTLAATAAYDDQVDTTTISPSGVPTVGAATNSQGNGGFGHQ